MEAKPSQIPSQRSIRSGGSTEQGCATQVDLVWQRDPRIEGRLCGCMEEVDSAWDALEQ